jgi:hypothetical protein
MHRKLQSSQWQVIESRILGDYEGVICKISRVVGLVVKQRFCPYYAPSTPNLYLIYSRCPSQNRSPSGTVKTELDPACIEFADYESSLDAYPSTPSKRNSTMTPGLAADSPAPDVQAS